MLASTRCIAGNQTWPLRRTDMSEAESTKEFVRRLRSRDPAAAEKLFKQYGERLVRIAGKNLSRKLTGRVEGEDVVQSVFRTFFRRTAEGQFKIDTSDEIWRLLVTITLVKSRQQGRHHSAKMRDVARETQVDELYQTEAVVKEPGPEEAAVFVDQIDSLLRGLPELYCDVLRMRLAGNSAIDTAASLGVSRQTVYRALALLKKRLRDAESKI